LDNIGNVTKGIQNCRITWKKVEHSGKYQEKIEKIRGKREKGKKRRKEKKG